ncbi:isopentenyl-diphosphate delta-isomerase [Mycolicibacterium sp. GF69]|uniref:isopentenyl-diphosphate Delta-isomerase n=1 Tax=Mycolicibacterium sp. GF69 TaxID=2267251 RepID=UPI000DCD78AD|nr:isopentenyl-diphosphate Delta-isomerase [Mycolicibacterium sp. GF69]RAV14532.1 isopentenyl-diphosphate delta-isomerase [Mycolicibacterium sp. GF69]
MSASTPSAEESVVLLDEDGRRIGSAPKAGVHHTDTPLHLGFSCYLFDADGRVLLTRRALGKKTWPGVWSNSFCGHPAPGEHVENAVCRRAGQELGVAIDSLTCVLPDFRYRAVAADGTVENEMCPVFVAHCQAQIQPDPDEVMEWIWVSWDQLRATAGLPWAISPWAAEQIPLLEERYVRGPLQGSCPQFINE